MLLQLKNLFYVSPPFLIFSSFLLSIKIFPFLFFFFSPFVQFIHSIKLLFHAINLTVYHTQLIITQLKEAKSSLVKLESPCRNLSCSGNLLFCICEKHILTFSLERFEKTFTVVKTADNPKGSFKKDLPIAIIIVNIRNMFSLSFAI